MTATVHPKLAEHAKRFSPQIWQSGSRVFTAYGYNIANVSMIVGQDGLIIVDTSAQETHAAQILAEFRKISDLPIKAVVYTHFHNDHVNGVCAFVTQEQIDKGDVQIFAHTELMRFIAGIGGYLAPLMGRRASYQFGAALPRNDTGFVHAGLGMPHDPGPRGFLAPTNTTAVRQKLRLCGVDLELVPLPGESDDHLGVWLPEDKIILTGDTIQGEALPNVYTLRGTPYRDPMQWVQTLDFIRDGFDADIVIPHHGRRLIGRTMINGVITAYRDAIQFMLDQTIRGMNKGLRPADIAREMKLPPHLEEHEWLGSFYGHIKHIVPSIAGGNVGWFTGDPLTLDPLPEAEIATRKLALMGGNDRVEQAAVKALEAEDLQWAMELARLLRAGNQGEQHWRDLEAKTLRMWAYAQINPTWRNWALCCALELDAPTAETHPKKQYVMAPPGVLKSFPPALILKTMTTRLKAEDALDVRLTLAFDVPELEAEYGLEIRRGVCQFHQAAPKARDATLVVPRQFFIDLAMRKTTWPQAIEQGALALSGTKEAALAFFGYFERPTAPSDINFVG